MRDQEIHLPEFTFRERLKQEKREIEQIVSWIQPSSNSIKLLIICQDVELNTYTRQSSQSMPKLHFLMNGTQAARSGYSTYWSTEAERKPYALRNYQTGYIKDLQDQDLKWISKVDKIQVRTTNSMHALRSVLISCSKPLGSFSLEHYFLGQDQILRNLEPISMDVLVTLTLSADSMHQHPQVFPILSIIAPNLKHLTCRLSQLQNIDACSLVDLNVEFEGEEASATWYSESQDCEKESCPLRLLFLTVFAPTDPDTSES